MRTITIDTDVFAKLWSLRSQGEEDENTILRRVLGVGTIANRESAPKVTKAETGESKVLWRDDVCEALREAGGKAHLSEIYQRVRSRRRAAGRSVPAELDAIVRRELENNSSDAGAYTGKRDWFRSVDGLGKGLWALKDDHK